MFHQFNEKRTGIRCTKFQESVKIPRIVHIYSFFLTVQLNPRVEATIKLVHARLSQFFLKKSSISLVSIFNEF